MAITPVKDNLMRQRVDRFLAADERERKKLFVPLCQDTSDENVQLVFSSLSQRRDTESLYWLVEFLVRVQTEHALQKLMFMLDSENEVERLQARTGLEKVDPDLQIRFLLAFLNSNEPDKILFASPRIGQLGLKKAVPDLLAALNGVKDSESIKALLKALGKLRDPRAVGTLEKFAFHPEADIQEQALSALFLTRPEMHTRFIVKSFESRNHRTRRFAYHSLIKLRAVRWESWIARHLKTEDNSALVCEVLASIRSVRCKELFRVIQGIAAHPPCPEAGMRASSLLLRVRTPKLLHWIREDLSSGTPELKILNLRLLSAPEFILSTAPDILKLYGSETDRRVRLYALSSLQHCSLPQVRDFLWSEALKGDSFSVAAACVLSEKLNPSEWPKIEACFASSSQTSFAVQRILLAALSRVTDLANISESLQLSLQNLIVSPNPWLRYHAVHVFGRFSAAHKLQRLMLLSVQDPEAMVRKAAYDELLLILSAQPGRLAEVLSICFSVRELFPSAIRLFRDISAGDLKTTQTLLSALFEMIQKYDRFPRQPMNIARLHLLIRSLALKERSLFVSAVSLPQWTLAEKELMLRAMNKIRLFEMEGLPEDFLKEDFPGASKEIKKEILLFVSRRTACGEAFKTLLYEAFETETNFELRELLEKVISGWVQTSLLSPSLGPRTVV